MCDSVIAILITTTIFVNYNLFNSINIPMHTFRKTALLVKNAFEFRQTSSRKSSSKKRRYSLFLSYYFGFRGMYLRFI